MDVYSLKLLSNRKHFKMWFAVTLCISFLGHGNAESLSSILLRISFDILDAEGFETRGILEGWAKNEVSSEEFPVVEVEEGIVQGKRMTSVTNGTFWSFQGLPYARPPLGPLRFKDSQPPEAWEGVRDARKAGQVCTQFFVDIDDYTGGEDCLFLNVNTPQLPTPDRELLPVMFFMHGGGFVFGNGNIAMYGPDYLVSDGVILVTINYRLGPFGFLYLDEAAPGNAGLKDQVMALRWVQRNIAAFGGDPNQVTIFGESAGGTSVHMHMMSPMSKGLFHRAISHSGCSLNPWATQQEAVETTLRLARAVGCTDDNAFAIVECLRHIDNMKLMRAANEKAPSEEDRRRLVRFTFVPVPEKFQFPGVERFVTPSLSVHNDVPYITGFNDREGLYPITINATLFETEDDLKSLDASWDQTVLPELRVEVDKVQNSLALGSLRDFFLDGKPLTEDTLPGYIDMFSDLTFLEGISYILEYMVSRIRGPLYLYVFTIDDELNFLKRMHNVSLPGACHADELGYVFNIPSLPKLPNDAPAAAARRQMVRLWTNFAKYGDPTPADNSKLSIKWKPFTEEEKNFLDIGLELRPGTDPNAKRFDFWKSFYDKYPSKPYVRVLPRRYP